MDDAYLIISAHPLCTPPCLLSTTIQWPHSRNQRKISYPLKKEKIATEPKECAKKKSKPVCHSIPPKISQFISRCNLELPYSWTQELGEVDITVAVPQGTRGKDLAITIQKKKLSVGLKGQEPLMAGELCKEIKVEDSTWTLRESLFVLILSH